MKKECHWKCDCTHFIFCYRKSRKIGVVILVLCFLVIRQEFDPEREEWRKSIWALDIMIEIWNTMEPAADLGIWLKQGTSWIFDFKYSYFIPNFFQYHKVLPAHILINLNTNSAVDAAIKRIHHFLKMRTSLNYFLTNNKIAFGQRYFLIKDPF